MKLNRWVYAILGVVICLCGGLVYAWTVMSQPIGQEYTEWSQAELSFTFTLTMMFFCIGGLVTGFLSKKIKPRYFVWVSAALMFIGFFLSSSTSSLGLLYLGFGVLCGMASGFAYTAVMGTVCQWFPDKQGLISGILLMGFGLSAFIVNNLYAAFTPDYIGGWRVSFRFMGILLLVVLAIGGIIIKKPGADFKAPGLVNPNKVVREPAQEASTVKMLKTPSFWLYYAWTVLTSVAGLVLVSQATGIAKQVGPTVDTGIIAFVVGLISILNGVGRVFFGAMFDKFGYKVTMITDMAIFMAGGLILIAALSTGAFPLIVIGFIVGGFAYGGVTPTNSAVTSDFFGRTNYAMNFSIINTCLLIASFGSTIAGSLYDSSGSYFTCLIMFIVVIVLSFVSFLFIRRPNSNKK